MGDDMHPGSCLLYLIALAGIIWLIVAAVTGNL